MRRVGRGVSGDGDSGERRLSLMGNVIDFRKCESLESQRLTEPEREKLEELLREAGE
jgi:hypothetical protein